MMSSSGAADNTQLSSQAFLQLLVAQLQYQDPSQPVDTSSFMNETATLTQVQTMEQNAQASTEMLAAQRAQTASSLVGHTVSYTASDGSTKTGYVSAATISSANPTLQIADSQVGLSQIQQVLASSTP
jgi:flagellar basal-body rod modification protein FlgD